MRLFILSISLLVGFNFTGLAQGYLGKKNEVGIEFYNLVVQNQVSIFYKYSAFRYGAFYFSYSRDMEGGILKQDAHFYTGNSFRFAYLYNSPAGGVPMPLGYYTGIGAGYDRGSLNNIIPVRNYHFNLYYGKNTFILANVNLDISLVYSISIRNYQTNYSQLNNLDYHRPFDFPYVLIHDAEVEFNVENDRTLYWTFGISPQVKLSYMF